MKICTPSKPDSLHDYAFHASAFLKTIANESRVLILHRLMHGEASVADLREAIPVSQSALSQHLNILLRANLVKARREAQFAYYSLSKERKNLVASTLNTIFGDI